MESPSIIVKNAPLDIALCELLGEKQADFVVLCADGETVPFYGTPFDSPNSREEIEIFVQHLNDTSSKSWWPEFFTNWKSRFCKHYNLPEDTTAETFRPKFSWAISRVCAGYSEHLHAAVGLLDKVNDHACEWSLNRGADGNYEARLYRETADGLKGYRQKGDKLSLVIAQVVHNLLSDVGGQNS